MTSTPTTAAARVALYAGSFDPITHGHEDLIRRTLTFTDKVIVAVANNVSKQPLFSVDERVRLITEIMGHDHNIEVQKILSSGHASSG